MSYDFFVFPADRADGLEEALALYEATALTGTASPGGPVARFVADLGALSPTVSAGGFLSAPVDGSDDGAYVCTSWDDPMGNLRAVAGAARPHDLAVLDVQLGALYDPRGALDVVLTTEAGPQLPFLTRAVLTEVMTHVREGRYHWVNLSRDDASFVQTFRDDDGSWAVEHREHDGHFAARIGDGSLVEGLLWAWARGDGGWRAMLEFSPVEV